MRQLCLLLAALLAFSTEASAQVEDQIDDAQFIESTLEKEDQELEEIQSQQRARDKVDYSGAKEATPYSDLVTIQKTMLPKSKRFRGMLGLSFLPNDVFYTTFGLDARFGYDLTETWGMEGEALFLSSMKGEDKKGLEETQGVRIDSLSTLRSFYGFSVLYTPFYGKTAFGSKIVPFEIYTILGLGQVSAGNSDQSAAIKVGVGELFSWDRTSALRLELSFLFYKSKTILNTEQNSNVLLLTIGYDRFFTKAGGR